MSLPFVGADIFFWFENEKNSEYKFLCCLLNSGHDNGLVLFTEIEIKIELIQIEQFRILLNEVATS